MNNSYLIFLLALLAPFFNCQTLPSSTDSPVFTPPQEFPNDLIEGYRSKVENPTPQLIDDLYGEKIGIHGFSYFLKTVAQNPILLHEMLLALHLDNEAFYPHFYRTPHEKAERLRYLPFVYGPRIRSHFLNYITSSLRINSEYIRENLQKKSHWDIVVVGAGFHGALLVNRIKAEQPDADILIIDKESLPSQHFYKGGHYFRMNNTLNEKDEGPSFQRDEKYNIPHTYGPIQVTDITGHRWPTAKLLAEVGRITLFSSCADCLLNMEIISVSKKQETYLLRTSDGNTITANTIVFATGLGKPNIPCKEEESKKILENAVWKSEISGEDKIMTVEQAFGITSKIEPLSIWKSNRDVDVILIGFGNSALTFLEFLYSIGPDNCYQFESIQSKSTIKTAVITGSSIKSVTVADISKKLRPRYSGLLSPIKEGQVKLFAGTMTKVRHLDDGAVEVFYTTPTGTVESLVGNRLILGTGYQLKLENLLNTGGFNITKEDFIPIKEFVVDSKVPVPIAKKLANEEIYIVGPAAGRDIVDVNHSTNGVPLVEIGQAEAIPYTSILTESFAVKLANTLSVMSGRKVQSKITRMIEADSLSPSGESTPFITMYEKNALVKNFVTDSINEEISTELTAQLIQLFSHIYFKNFAEIKLKFYWKKDQLYVQGDYFKKIDIEQLSTEIKKNSLLLCLLAGYISPSDTLTFNIKVNREKKQSIQLIPESSDLTLLTRNYNTAYVNTSNSMKKKELTNLFGKHDVQLFFAPTYPLAGQGTKIEKAIAKANSVGDGIIVEDNTLEIEEIEGSKEIQDDLKQLESFIGKKVTWTCFVGQKRGNEIYIYRGVVYGELVPKAGEFGFGFDSYFRPVGATKTLGEEKLDKYNARSLAIQAFMKNQVYQKVLVRSRQ